MIGAKIMYSWFPFLMTTKSRMSFTRLGLGLGALVAVGLPAPGLAAPDAEGKALFNLWSAAFGFDAPEIESQHVFDDHDLVFTTHKTASEQGIVDLLKIKAHLPGGKTGRVVLLLSPPAGQSGDEDRFKDTIVKRKASILLKSPALEPELIGRIVDRAVAYHKQQTDERLIVVQKVPQSVKELVSVEESKRTDFVAKGESLFAKILARGGKVAAKAKTISRRRR